MSRRIESLPGLGDPILEYVRSGLQQGLQHAASRVDIHLTFIMKTL